MKKMDQSTFQPDSSSAGNDSAGVYRIDTVAKILDMPLRSAYDFCAHTDAFVVKRLGPRTLRVEKESFDRWLRGQSGTAPKFQNNELEG